MGYEYLGTIAIFFSAILTCYIAAKCKLLPHINTSSIGKRYFYLDGLRGLAAVCVINAHIWRLTNNGLRFSDFNINPHYVGLMGGFGVQIFFCITGFLFFDQMINKKYEFDWKKFYISRINRLAPLYLFMIASSILLASFLGDHSTPIVSTLYNSIKLIFFGFWGNGGGSPVFGYNIALLTASVWTLPYEWRFYLLMPLMALAMQKNKYISFSAVIIIATLTFIIETSAVWPFFLIGAISAYINKFKVNKIFSAILILISFVSCVLYFYIDHSGYDYISFISIMIIFIGVVSSKSKLLSLTPLVYLGEISYSIYLNHLIILILLSFTFPYFMHDTTVKPFSAVIMYSVSSIFICATSLLTFKYIEHLFMKKQAR